MDYVYRKCPGCGYYLPINIFTDAEGESVICEVCAFELILTCAESDQIERAAQASKDAE